MPNEKERARIRQIERVKRRVQRKKLKRRKLMIAGIACCVVVVLLIQFLDNKLSENSQAASEKMISQNSVETSAIYVGKEKNETSSHFEKKNDNTLKMYNSDLDSNSNNKQFLESSTSLNIHYVKESDTEKSPAEMNAGFTDELQSFQFVQRDTDLYERNSSRANVLQVVNKDTYVATYGSKDGWVKVEVLGQIGYLRERDLSKLNDDSIFYVAKGQLIVNKKHGLPLAYKTEFNNEAESALRVMKEAMERDGLSVEIATKYRSSDDEQKELVLRGNPKDAPEPGHSVFQTGLAVQFYVQGTDPRLDNHFEGTKQYQWLSQHAKEYGFILRYPKGSEEITGYRSDSTIFYYVGTADALKIADSGLTMEQYYGN